jgi:hypothetical protein
MRQPRLESNPVPTVSEAMHASGAPTSAETLTLPAGSYGPAHDAVVYARSVLRLAVQCIDGGIEDMVSLLESLDLADKLLEHAADLVDPNQKARTPTSSTAKVAPAQVLTLPKRKAVSR